MLIILGIYFLLLSIMLDDVVSWLLFIKGFGVFETNPIYVYFGVMAFMIILLLLYLFLGFAWIWVLKYYDKVYREKRLGWKYYDIFVFLVILIFTTIICQKIQTGLDNIGIMAEYSLDNDKRAEYNTNLSIMETYRIEHPNEFKSNAVKVYTTTYTQISYFEFILYCMVSFILFKGNYKIAPYEYA